MFTSKESEHESENFLRCFALSLEDVSAILMSLTGNKSPPVFQEPPTLLNMAAPGRKFRYTSRRTKSARMLLMVVALFGITGLTGFITGKTHSNSVIDPQQQQQQQQHRVKRHVSFPQGELSLNTS